MCSTRAVAESTNCSCVRNPSQAMVEAKAENPVIWWCIRMTGKALVLAVGIVFAGVVLAIAGIALVLRWGLGALWSELALRPKPVVVPTVTPVKSRQATRPAWDLADLRKRIEVTHER